MNDSTDNVIAPGPAQDFGMRELIAQLWNRRWWLAASVVVFTVAAAILAFATTPVYRSVVVVVPANSERNKLGGGLASAIGQLGGLASLAGIDIGGGEQETEEAKAVLKSRDFTEAFIRDRQIKPKLFPDKWDGRHQRWRPGKEPTAAQAYKLFDKKIRSLLQDKKTGLVTLQIDWTDPQEAADWANDLVRRVNAEMRSRAITQANASVGYLEKELKNTSTVATREAINRLIESQINRRMLANVTSEYAFRVVDKALPADLNDPVKPQKMLLVGLGPFVGFAVAVGVILFLGLLRPIMPTTTHD